MNVCNELKERFASKIMRGAGTRIIYIVKMAIIDEVRFSKPAGVYTLYSQEEIDTSSANR